MRRRAAARYLSCGVVRWSRGKTRMAWAKDLHLKNLLEVGFISFTNSYVDMILFHFDGGACINVKSNENKQ